ncbi:MAG: gas vesicle protein GvpO [Elusimicrobiales bacterium]|nr:gas vesicle protein GvpO [Elusimicrobiales bacterium]
MDISEKAREVLAENTGFRMMSVSSVEKDGGFRNVEVDVLDDSARPGGVVRTYRVAFDSAGALHGYSLISYRIPRLRGVAVRSRPYS